MTDLWRFSGPTAPGFMLVLVVFVCALALVVLVLEVRRPPTRRGWDTRCSDRWRDEHREVDR